MSDDKKKDSVEGSPEKTLISRRKLVYVAPLIMSRSMIYRAAGCGKSDFRIQSCFQAPQSS